MFATPRECKVVASRPSRPLETAGETLWLYLHEGRKPDFWRYASNDRIPGWSRRLSSIPFTIASGYGGRPQDSNCFRSEIHSRAKIHMSHMGGCLVSNRTSRAHTAQQLGEVVAAGSPLLELLHAIRWATRWSAGTASSGSSTDAVSSSVGAVL
jgi:hypothetical protein